MTERRVLDLAMSVLEDMKAIDVLAIDVRELTSISESGKCRCFLAIKVPF